MSFIALIKAVPLAVSAIHSVVELGGWVSDKYDEFMADDVPVTAEKKAVKPSRKKSDTTRLTQHQFDFVLHAHEQWEQFNHNALPGKRKTLEDLTAVINDKLNLDKSSSAYRRVWNGTIKRETLPTGNQLSFHFGDKP